MKDAEKAMSEELMLKAAKLIYPAGSAFDPVIEDGRVILKSTKPISKEKYGDLAESLEFPSLVFSLENRAWQMDLQVALEKLGWEFSFNEGFHAEKDDFRHDDATGELLWFYAPTKPELLIKCVEATDGH